MQRCRRAIGWLGVPGYVGEGAAQNGLLVGCVHRYGIYKMQTVPGVYGTAKNPQGIHLSDFQSPGGFLGKERFRLSGRELQSFNFQQDFTSFLPKADKSRPWDGGIYLQYIIREEVCLQGNVFFWEKVDR